ncbi:MAG TPA: glycosyltransferase, partial [Casimicrobiaceae bacterium]|nr:glycosyltransferase [Casimicrobiaceae bacterium]
MTQSDVTIVVVPRDHFSDTQVSLESLCAQTPPCPIVYVDAGSPPRIARYLREQSMARGFDLVRVDHYVTPNHARNLGAARVKTRYVVFIDNDVVVAPSWLPPLIACADETGAAIVGPLNFERRPLLQTVHFAGGDTRIEVVDDNGIERRRLIDRIHKIPVPAGRTRTESAEFHCMLVRLDVLRALGGLDESMLSTRENIDFCLAVSAAGGTIYLEPESRITYLAPEPLRLRDVPFFALRWSDLWDLSSFHHLRRKWHLDEDEYFLRQYRNLGWRRQGMMMRGVLLRWVLPWRLRGALERSLRPLERHVNAQLARRHAKRHGVPIEASIARSYVGVDANAAPDRPVHLLVVPWNIDHPGGIEQVATNLYRRLDAGSRYSPEILVASWPHRTPLSTVKDGRRVSYLRVRMPISRERGLRTFVKWLVSLPFELVPLVRYLRERRVATINIHYPSLAALQFLLASTFVPRRPRIVLSFHGLDLVNASKSRGAERFAWSLLMRRAH